MQHSEVPHEIDKKKEAYNDSENSERILQHGDKVIYAAIRLYMNAETRTCFPSIELIKKKTNCGYAKVTSAIKRLIDAGFMELRKTKLPNGKWSNLYYFPKTEFDKNFEMFSSDFFDLDIPINIKEYYMDIQKYMYDKETGIGKIGYSDTKLAELTGWTPQSVKKYNAYLKANSLLDEVPTGKFDEAGFQIMKKEFNLTSFQQAAFWVKAVTEQITANTQQLNVHSENIENIRSQLIDTQQQLTDTQAQLKDTQLRMRELERQMAIKNTKIEYPETYKF